MDEIKNTIRRILCQRRKTAVTDLGLKPSGVLVPLFQKGGRHHILFTKRSQKVEHHKGQISFPGGAYDEEDGTLVVTALRETDEEIGLKSLDVEILGELDDVVTTTNFVIAPFVGCVPYPYKFKMSDDEIDELIEVPVQALLNQERYREDLVTREDETYGGYAYEYNGHTIWGATAKILKQFLDLVFTGGSNHHIPG